MTRRSIATLALLASTAVGCGQPRPAAAPPSPTSKPSPIAVDYAIGEVDRPIVQGRVDVDGKLGARVRSEEPQSSVDLVIRAERVETGRTVLRVEYREWRRDDGRQILWNPSLVVRDGQSAVVDVSGEGWSRSLKITTHTPG